MESTGSYWIPVFNLLEGHFIVVLANPEEVKNRKGHKTDRKDAEHLADLLCHSHVRSSYIPPGANQCARLRDLTRRRIQLTQDASRERNRRTRTHDEVIATVRNLPMTFVPGEHFHYNNRGYFLLGVLIEKVSGESYEQFLTEHIFVPAGMADTRLDEPVQIIPKRVPGYSLSGGKLVNPHFSMTWPSPEAGALNPSTISSNGTLPCIGMMCSPQSAFH